MAHKIMGSFWVDGDIVSYHLFTVPQYGEKDFYRLIRIYEGFKNREAKGLYDWMDEFRAGKKKTPHPPKRMSLRHFEDVSAQWEFREIGAKIFFHDGILSLMRHIGYDNVKKKYV